MAEEYLGTGNDDGVVLGRDADDKVGFYGATPVARGDAIADATDATTAISQLNDLLARVRTMGMIASS